MRKLTDAEVKDRAVQLRKRHRSEWARLAFEACVDRSINQTAELMGGTPKWIRELLDLYAFEEAATGGGHRPPLHEGKSRGRARCFAIART